MSRRRRRADPTTFKLNDTIIYQMIGDENRIRSRKQLRDVMIYILNLLHRCYLYAQEHKMKFHGLTLYEMQNYLKRAGISADAVRENLRKLHLMGLILKRKMNLDDVRFKYAYFNIDTDAFPCRYGKWIVLPNDLNQLDAIYVFNCTKYPFCPCVSRNSEGFNPKMCTMPSQLNSLIEKLPAYLSWLKVKKWDPEKKKIVENYITE